MATRWNQGKWGDGSHWLSAAEVAALTQKGNKVSKIKLSLFHVSIANVVVYLKAIVAKMTGNAKFTTCAAKTTALNTAVAALDAANTDYEGAKTTADQKMTVRDNAFAAANDAAHALATAAEDATTDAADLQSGGWELVSDRAPVGQLHPPANFSGDGRRHGGVGGFGVRPATRGAGACGGMGDGPGGAFHAGLHGQEIQLHHRRAAQRRGALVPHGGGRRGGPE